jgi:hypothetical protein
MPMLPPISEQGRILSSEVSATAIVLYSTLPSKRCTYMHDSIIDTIFHLPAPQIRLQRSGVLQSMLAVGVQSHIQGPICRLL